MSFPSSFFYVSDQERLGTQKQLRLCGRKTPVIASAFPPKSATPSGTTLEHP